MGFTVYNTGWFGRGNSGKKYKEIYETKNIEYLSRPAIKQAKNLAKQSIAYREGSHEYNIWYNRFAGDSLNNEKSFEPAESRLKVDLHAGYTKADKEIEADEHKKLYFCIFFARGKCAKGVECSHFHRLPTYADVARYEKDMLHDVFGRERHATQRDDMDGVGSFNDPSRTLYIGRVERAKYMDNPKGLREALFRHFSEFGEVENVNVIWRLSIAFVRFRFRTQCEFAKVAMSQQSLDYDEVLVLRWAYDDPNPLAKEAIKRANADAVVTAIAAVGGGKKQKVIGPQLPNKKQKR